MALLVGSSLFLPQHEFFQLKEKQALEIRKGRLQLKLLSTLGFPSQLEKWLPLEQCEKNPWLLSIGAYKIVLKAHYRKNIVELKNLQDTARLNRKNLSILIKLINKLQEASSSIPELKQDVLSHFSGLVPAINYSANSVHRYTDGLLSYYSRFRREVGDVFNDYDDFCHIDLINLFCEINGISNQIEAIDELEKLFGLSSSDIFQCFIDKRSRWYHCDGFVIPFRGAITLDYVFSSYNPVEYRKLQHDILRLPSLRIGDKIVYSGTNHHFYGDRRPAPIITYPNKKQQPQFYLLETVIGYVPLSCWKKAGSLKHYLLPILPPPPYVFFNWTNEQTKVFLTSSLEIATMNQTTNFLGEQFPILSWYGGEKTVKDLAWECLVGKKVTYILRYDNDSIALAAIIYRITLKLGINMRFGEFRVEEKCVMISISSELKERIQKKADELAISEREHRKQATVPYTVINDTSKNEPQKYIQHPFMAEKSISLLYSKTGSGKTWLALSIAYASSLGKSIFEGRKGSRKKVKTFYIDSEMGESALKNRLRIIETMYGVPLIKNKHFHCISIDPGEMALDSSEAQISLGQYIKSSRMEQKTDGYLVVIDNVLAATDYSDHSKSWNNLFRWLKRLRENGATVLVVHHANETGKQRGSGIKTAVVDNVIRVEREKTTEKSSSIPLELIIEKNRSIASDIDGQFNLEIHFGKKSAYWTSSLPNTSEDITEKVIELLKQGFSVKEITEKTNYSRAWIYRIKKKLENPIEEEDLPNRTE
jgi:KaiC/GvpD/RAD55 family RecA-like ATPase